MQFRTDTAVRAAVPEFLCFKKTVMLFVSLLMMAVVAQPLLAQDIASLNAPVSIQHHNGSLSGLLETLGKQSGYTFFYDKEELGAVTIKDAHYQNSTLGKVLQNLHQSYNLAYKITGKNIAVRRKKLAAISDSTVNGNGRIFGTIVDAETGELVNGATVVVANKNLLSNMDGEFSIALPAGKYAVQVSFVGYNEKKLPDVLVRSGATTTTTINLNRLDGNLSTVTVRASARKDNISGLLIRQKNNMNITDGISTEQISRTPDKNIGEVLKRITGLSTVDNRYVVVRGLSERYNGAILNGQILPSTELNRKNFNFEIIPSNMIDNVIVNKTITADMSAEFGGGLVQVNTRAVPTEDYFSITGGLSINERTTGKDFMGLELSNRSYLGLVSKDRYLAGRANWNSWSDIVADDHFEQASAADDAVVKFKNPNDISNNWKIYHYKPLPSFNFQISGGKVFQLKANRSIGAMASISYRNNWQQQDIYTGRDGFFNGLPGVQDNAGLDGDRYGFSVNLAGIAAVGYTAPKTKLQLQTVILNMLDQQFAMGAGVHSDWNDKEGYYDITMQTSLKQYQFKGEQLLNKRGMKFNWGGSYLEMIRQKPDNHVMWFDYNKEGEDTPGSNVDFTVVSATNAFRIFSRALEKNFSWNADYTIPFSFKLFSVPFNNSLKAGYAGWSKDRKFFVMNVTSATSVNGGLPLSEYFAPEHTTTKITRFGDQFPSKGMSGVATLHAGFMMMEQKIAKKFRLVYGVRGEYLNLNHVNRLLAKKMETEGGAGIKDYDLSEMYSREPNMNLFPSANLTYALTPKMNLRLAYSKSIIRPDLRELSYFREYDYELGGEYASESQVISTRLDNYDFRYEFYPSAGELISVSLFYKKIKYPMEIFESQPRRFVLRNSKEAVNKGIELEVRKNFAFTGVKALKGLTVFGNFTRLFATVTPMTVETPTIDKKIYVVETLLPEQKRPQVGASNFIYNAGLYYDIKQFSFSASWNKVSVRTYRADQVYGQSIFEKPIELLDAQISYKFLQQKAQVKLSLSNLLNSYYVVYSNMFAGGRGDGPVDANGNVQTPTAKDLEYDKNTDVINFQAINGRSASISFTYNF